MTEPCDSAVRRRALAVEASFIVQAPAGSGKTELLTRRLLALLATVDEPEEIVAITFTRKAAAEMRGRLSRALAAAREAIPDEPHAAEGWRLAQAVVQRDTERGWELYANPGRLRIHTIDALCAALARQMPILSGLGAQPAVSERAELLYREAARRTVVALEEGGPAQPALQRLVAHRNNDPADVVRLLAEMLPRRDQWLRHVIAREGEAEAQRDELEAALRRLVGEELRQVHAALGHCLDDAFWGLAQRAVANLLADGAASPLLALDGCTRLPAPEPSALPQWHGLAALLLTADGKPRSRLTVREGFPAAGSGAGKAERQQHKEAMQGFLQRLVDDAAARDALRSVAELPQPRYSDAQWELLYALLTLLPLAAAHLKLLFAELGEADHAEVARAALDALGDDDAPTDLALALDYRIRHLLVDEFQDTSHGQFRLLERLTAGWQPGDGRSLFLVGDPMQSIYRFREADVGLFLRAREHGIGDLWLEALTLQVNFRSQAGVVDWVNRHFAQVLAAHEEIASGAVPYSPAQPWHPALAGEAVGIGGWQVSADDDGDPHADEAQRVVELVMAARRDAADGSIAILVRARSHLAAIVPALQQAGLAFRAIEIESLARRPVVGDLLALTRALCHFGDRTAWLAVLRAPWCGLSLATLEQLAQWPGTLWQACSRVVPEEAAEAARLQRFSTVMAEALQRRRRMPLHRLLEGCWHALGGPACVDDATALEDAEVYLELLAGLESAGDLDDPDRLAAEVENLYARPDIGADDSLQLLTMHKAKGLEFDTVIVPRLGSGKPPQQPPLLRWLERSGKAGDELLLAPIAASGDEVDPIQRLLQRYDNERAVHEDGRLLYVAATRARKRLHLLGTIRETAAGALQPNKGSALERLWPALGDHFCRHAVPTSAPAPGTTATAPLRRLPLTWRAAPPPPAVGLAPDGEVDAQRAEAVEYVWAGSAARSIGSVVHLLLQRIAEEGLTAWPQQRITAYRATIRRLLQRHAVDAAALEAAQVAVETALCNVLDDPRGRWLLAAEHAEARNEYALSALLDGRLVDSVIDRTFVDGDGVRWIVDYKTGSHQGGDLDAFLDNEQARYRPQLERYAAVLRLREGRPQRVGLYFPLVCGWREWAPGEG